MRIAPQLTLLLALTVSACGDDSKPQTDTADTADTSDTTEPGDTATPDDTDDETSGPDTTEPADTAPDTTADVEVSPPCTPDAEIFDDPRVILCGSTLTFVFYGEDLSPSACPPYYRINDTKYPSLEALAAAENCDASCEYRGTMGVDLIGCESGFRTGYEVYEPLTDNSCLDAVYATPIGLLSDLCLWPEKTCRADCNPACAEGTIGTLDAHQLSGAAGTKRVATSSVGQSFRAEKSGILTGLELRLTRCDMTTPATLSILDPDGVELAWAELASPPEGCESTTDLASGAPGLAHFAIEDQCLAVETGDTLHLVVNAPSCDTPPCGDGFGLGYATNNPYTPGNLFLGETAVPSEDLSFKAFIE